MSDVIEPAPSGRSKCRACRQPIAKAELRFGEQVPNPYGEGDTHFWYHPRCAALRLPEKLESLLLSDGGAAVENREDLITAARQALRHALLPKIVRADRAPTARARCQGCRQGIDKGALRIVLERMDEGISSAAGFMHPGCAAKEVSREELLQRLQYCEAELPADEQQSLRALIDA